MLASGALLGVIVGLAIRRDWRPLVAARPRWIPLLLIGLTARGVASFLPGFGFALYVLSIASTTLVAAANYRIIGAAVVAAGGLLNLCVVIANGGMPVDPGAVAVAGGTMPSDALHVVLTSTTRLRELSDLIAVPLLRSVYSVGDLLIALGGFVVPFMLLIRR